jgi:hypothetical protein
VLSNSRGAEGLEPNTIQRIGEALGGSGALNKDLWHCPACRSFVRYRTQSINNFENTAEESRTTAEFSNQLTLKCGEPK